MVTSKDVVSGLTKAEQEALMECRGLCTGCNEAGKCKLQERIREVTQEKMTEQVCMERIESLMTDLKNLVIERSRRLYHSGGIDPQNPDYAGEANFLLPKILITASLPGLIRSNTRPMSPKAKAAVANLEKF